MLFHCSISIPLHRFRFSRFSRIGDQSNVLCACSCTGSTHKKTESKSTINLGYLFLVEEKRIDLFPANHQLAAQRAAS